MVSTAALGHVVSERLDTVVRPKPVILVHGWSSNAATWNAYPGFLKAEHPNWEAYAVGDGKAPGVMDTGGPLRFGATIRRNAQILHGYIEGVRSQRDAWHVDIVAHSMGGLISRQYIQDDMPRSPDGRPVVRHLVMLGTPNGGSPCAHLIPGRGGLQLRMDWVIPTFNAEVTNWRNVSLSILAGEALTNVCDCLLEMIKWFGFSGHEGDSVVPVASAFFLDYVTDQGLTNTRHDNMTSAALDFYDFVRPRLAISSTGGVSAAAGAIHPAADTGRRATENTGLGPQLVFADVVQAAAGSSTDIEIQAPAGSQFGVTVAVSPTVGSTLREPGGAAVWTIEAGSADAAAPLRSYAADAPTPGVWRLRLDNQGAGPASAMVSAWIVGAPLTLTLAIGPPDAGRHVKVSATLNTNGAPIAGATVTVTFSGADESETAMALFDDGQHGDGQAGDGVYAATSGALPAAAYVIVARAQGPGFTRATTGVVEMPPMRLLFLPFIAR